MKLLLDQNLSHKLCPALSDAFPESTQVRMIGLDRASDGQIWDFARDNEFTVVTHDSDFVSLSALRGAPPLVVHLRCGNQPTRVIEQLLLSNLEQIVSMAAESKVYILELG